MESEAIANQERGGTGYRAITYRDLPEIKQAIRRVGADEFKAADVLPHLPADLQQVNVRELGRAMIARGLVVKVRYDRGAAVVRRA